MSRFAIRNPYFIVVVCLMIAVVGATSLANMPVDMFPAMDIPVVVVATFYSGMPPEQIETDITSRFERFFTLGAGIEHIESRSLPGVSVIKVYFQPGTNPDSAVTTISNLAMAQLRRLPPGTLPPVVLKFDASSLPVCLVTFQGEGLNETQLRDLAQFQVRNQIGSVPGASVPQPFGGKYRQIMVYTDPYKLEAHNLSLMDAVRSLNNANLILPAGDVQLGLLDYNIYTNSQLRSVPEIDQLPLRTVGQAPVRVADIGHAEDAQQIQTNIVRVDGQRSVYVPVMKQGGDTNTIDVVNGIKHAILHLFDVPKNLITRVVFDQSIFVKTAIETLLHEGAIGLFLTSVMILVFLGNMRATVAVFFSIPLSALAAVIALSVGGSSINSMVLGGLALAFSRLIDNSVVVLENIYRHLELGETREVAAEKGGQEVALPVLASTLTTIVVFFPVTLLYGVSKYLFSALALAVVLSLMASYAVAMSVVPLFCSKFISGHQPHGQGARRRGPLDRFNAWFNPKFEGFLNLYDRVVSVVLKRPVAILFVLSGVIVVSLFLFPLLNFAFFPRTDPGQFMMNVKLPSGTRIALTESEVAKVEDLVRRTVSREDLGMIVSNIGSTPDYSAIYTSNSGMHTATVQVSLKEGHKIGSYEYMAMVRQRIAREMPEITAYFQSGGLVDAVLSLGMPAPIDVQVAGSNLAAGYQLATQLAQQIRKIDGVGDIYVPQDIDYPALQLNIDRTRARELGLTQKEVVGNVITALTSNAMIAPSFWIDPKTGNDYMLTVQYPERQIRNFDDLRAIPVRGKGMPESTRLDNISDIRQIKSPTEVDHYALRRVMDIYVQPLGEDLSRIASAIDALTARTKIPAGFTVTQLGLVQGMRESFHRFGIGLTLSVVLLYLILVAQFRSFLDPLLILTAVPPGLTGALLILYVTQTSMNVMSLMGLMILIGMTVSDSILIVEFTRHLREDGMSVRLAIVTAARVRLRPVLMTSLATIIGLLPMALKLGAGSESYAPLARAVLGGMSVSLMMTVIMVPAAYYVAYRKQDALPAPEGIPLMSLFAIRNPYFIVVICLIIAVVGITSLAGMPVDMFPAMDIPVVVVATFYSGMPPEQIETDITSRFERFFTLGAGIEHIESRSLPGVSVIKVYFQPGTNPDSAVTTISNLAMAQLRRLPPGTLPPVVLKFDASSLPVCLVTFAGQGLNETTLRDLAQFQVRNQIGGVPGASVPQPFGGKYRQIMVYADPYKLEAHLLSLMDVVRSVNDSNLILPAGDVQIGPLDYNIYTNSQLSTVKEIDDLPIKMVGQSPVRIADIGHAEDGHQIQTNIVRVNGQRSVYTPVLKQGGDTNTIAVVDGVKDALGKLVDIPKSLVTKVVFDQSVFVKTAIETLLHEGGIGLLLTSLMILIFLGSMRATVAVFFSIPLSALAACIALSMGGSSINSMVLGGLALAFSRLIDNSVVVLENIYRHLEAGESPEVAAEKGGREVALPVLAATLTTVVVFFPVTFLYGVSRYLFTALALAVALSLFASFAVAMTVVPLFCARFIKATHHGTPSSERAVTVNQPKGRRSFGARFNVWFNDRFEGFLRLYDKAIGGVLRRPGFTLMAFGLAFAACLAVFPLLGLSFFPRTDAGQFVIDLKAPTGTRLSVTENEIAKVENLVRQVVAPGDLGMIVSNIGATPDFSAIYTTNSAQHTAFVQVSLKEDHKTGSYEYMARVKDRIARDLPELSAYFQSGGLVDAVLNMGLPAPIDVQVAGSNMDKAYDTALTLARRIRAIQGVADVFVPQDIDYPALQLNVDRTRASELGLDQQEVVDNIITALTSNTMIAPSFWIDPKTGNDYMLTVQYPEDQVKTLTDLKSIPLRGANEKDPTRLDMISAIHRIKSPTEVDHYALRRTIDVYVRPLGEDLGKIANGIDGIIAHTKVPEGLDITLRGMVQGMRQSFTRFALGLCLAVVLLYLILVAQFQSFIDPFIILLAVPPGLAGVILTLWLSSTTLNVMSLMGVVMLVGIAVSNSILIVEFTRHLRGEGMNVREAVAMACRVRLRPVLMTSLATIIGLLPMALKLGAGSEAYAPLARAILGGLSVSVALTVFLVPAAYVLVYGRSE